MTGSARKGPPVSRGWIDSPWFRNSAGWSIAQFLRLVQATNTMVREPPRPDQRRAFVYAVWPAIFVTWHANIFALNFFMEDGVIPGEILPLVSPHFDGQLAAAIIRTLGYRSITGTGASARQTDGTGGVQALRTMIRELKGGNSIWLTAEVPPTPGRRVSPGVIALARASGRPIVALAAASSRRLVLERIWDKLQVNLPFGRVVLLAAEPLYVDEGISNEDARAKLKGDLDRIYAEALRRADLKG